MTTVDELREVLEHRAGVPDPTGMIEAARARAVVVRRRRRITAATVVAGLVIAVVAVPVAVARLRTPDSPPATPAPHRGPGQSTVDVEPGAGFFVSTRRTNAYEQLLTVRTPNAGYGDKAGAITVSEPGQRDPAFWQKNSERITIGGHAAFYAPTRANRPADAATDAVIGWRDRSGVWVEVSQTSSRPALEKLAQAVRMGPPRRVVSPVQFGWLPDGIELSSVAASDDPAAPPNFPFIATVGLNAAPEKRPSAAPDGLSSNAVTMTVQKRTVARWKELVGTPSRPGVLGAPKWRTIGGQRAWYFPRGSKGMANWTSNLLIENGRCGVELSLGVPGLINYDELVRMVDGMTFADCTDPTTWTPPLK